ESCNSYSTRNKSEAYDDNKGVMAFKIDVEIARYVGDDKIIDDSGNLSREGKDIMDSFIDNNCHTLFSWMLQIEGSSISFSTLYPTAPGLYAHL
ncbi:hypothetical protein EDC94DRAFT_501970, partial [Helicostylum pulchrum]